MSRCTSMSRIRLGVNIDHIATLREVRKASYPDLLDAARICKRAGGDQITIHLREDRRHIQDPDVPTLIRKQSLPVNLEMAFTDEMVRLAAKWKPFSITLVPERREEMTTESGLNLAIIKRHKVWLKKLKGIRVYGFIDADIHQVELAAALQMDGVEFHTGTFANAFAVRKTRVTAREVSRLHAAAECAAQLGLEVKAGHGLTVGNVKHLLTLARLSELNIGHSIVARSIFVGLAKAIREMKHAMKN
jgi:pyridoxine 5-phosphate synthase